MVRRHRLLGVLPLALTLMLGACAPAPQSPAPTTSASTAPSTQTVASVVLGKAFLDAPLNGATVKILDPSGAVLQETANATDPNGFFAVSLPSSQLKDFRVEVSGGTRGDAPSTVVLKADVRNFNPLIDRIYVNAATTLVAAKLDLAPQASLSDTQAAVAHFLKLPDGISVGMGLDNPTLKAFSQQRFMTVAEGQGGFSALISELAGQVSADSTTTYDFSHLLLGDSGNILGSIAVEIGKGALGEIGGSLMGSALSALGLGGDDGSAERQQQLLEQFAAQRQLTLVLAHQMETRMGDLQKNITEVKDSIAALQANMNQQFGLAAYNDKVNVLYTPLGSIDALY
ncbi:MAG TPA: hypothetical protein V6D05_08830, partial [Stenomitos sp.]